MRTACFIISEECESKYKFDSIGTTNTQRKRPINWKNKEATPKITAVIDNNGLIVFVQ
ncbi:hypothetical protein LPTSP2_16710 [Leptospira ellinghausenii]|uniref:Uncharacterized protein n=1 Tax=Leptospira ellinghausenii TaxID=1917822 RepID=A0A2P2DCN8_9LEPT|nr:hypothetical protein LPTSP2_16710 [Leptospira ellinghausenii]